MVILVFNTPIYAQVPEWADSVKELKYQLDTVSVIDTTPDEATVYAEDEDESGEDTVDQVYFLSKEFAGGLPDSLSFRQVPGDIVRKLKADKDFWYVDEVLKKTKERDTDSSFSGSPILQTILWLVIIGGFLTFLLIYLGNSNSGLFRKSRSVGDEDENAETSDIFSINFQAEIAKAAAAENFRLATRLMFLQLLRIMSDTGIIQYSQDSTNLDYMMQLRGTRHYEEFFRLARHYEYSWYGQFGLDREKYNLIKKAFDNFEYNLQK